MPDNSLLQVYKLTPNFRVVKAGFSSSPYLTSSLGELKNFIKLGRLKFLPYSATLAMLGAVARCKFCAAHFCPWSFVHAWLFVWLAHIATHYCNEYYDYEVDVINKRRGPWNGGSGMLVQGLISRSTALVAGLFTVTAAAALVLCSLMYDSNSPFARSYHICAAILFINWFYTAPPFRLQYRMLGELSVAVALTILAPLAGAAMQTGSFIEHSQLAGHAFPMQLLQALVILAVQQFARMMVMNAPDVESDLIGGKITFTAAIGVRRAAALYCAAQCLVTLAPLTAAVLGMLPWAVALAFVAVSPLAYSNARRFVDCASRPEQQYGDLPFYATLHVFASATAVLVAFLIA
eukprot:CAMPEP_0202895900 /NCGR_PEP_ID=MMETSP1392-20130828/5011_1 /ASSEMBLY_ACC=CAM_ASM_000868 /TAXON_ID=225041 /ORGANISM="Chlamydomonas chlamydogama, Strain SAG 11-48b" /LENGTH=348 /DNA_ID=CAMNT_0049581073 /DNA_START=319 /DNA_END=1365 /DNA_ORIENTATION=-